MNDRTVMNPLVQVVRRAQQAVQEGQAWLGPSKADTIATLDGILRTEATETAIVQAEQYTARKVCQAQAAFLPALEAAHNKLTQLRPHYDGTMGMSIDNNLASIAAMLAVAREAAR